MKIIIIDPHTKKQINFSKNSDIRKLPKLYCVDSHDTKRVWKCWVEGSVVYTRYGTVEGKKITRSRIFEGKSIGKKNETTSEEQAWAEANKKWISQLDNEYLPEEDDEEGQKLLKGILKEKKKNGGHNINAISTCGASSKKKLKRDSAITNIDTSFTLLTIPMKAAPWDIETRGDLLSVLPKVSNYFKKPFYAQPKLDGWRAAVILHRGNIIITSNSGKQYSWFTHLRKLFLEWFNNIEKAGLSECVLDGFDGEMYAHEFVDGNGEKMDPLLRFSTVCSICALRRSQPHPLEDQIQYNCFDLVDKSKKYTQTQRFEFRDQLFSVLPKTTNSIIKVDTRMYNSIEDAVQCVGEYEKLGYEGAIFRTAKNIYKCGGRSLELRKLKNFIDEEYEIIGCKLDKGVSADNFVWLLKTKDGKKFSAKPGGSEAERIKFYTKRDKYIGKMLTVKFQEYTEDGVPRFPTAKAIRSGVGVD